MTTAVAHWLSSLIILFIFVVMLFLIVPFPSISLLRVNCSIEHDYFPEMLLNDTNIKCQLRILQRTTISPAQQVHRLQPKKPTTETPRRRRKRSRLSLTVRRLPRHRRRRRGCSRATSATSPSPASHSAQNIWAPTKLARGELPKFQQEDLNFCFISENSIVTP